MNSKYGTKIKNVIVREQILLVFPTRPMQPPCLDVVYSY